MLTNVVTQLESQVMEAQTNLAQFSADLPRRASTVATIATLRKSIAETRERLGGGGDAVAARVSEYEGVKIAQDFADTALVSARQGLEAAPDAIIRQQKYFFVISKSVTENIPAYPRPWVLLLPTLLACAVGAFGFIAHGMPLMQAIRQRLDCGYAWRRSAFPRISHTALLK